MCLFRKDGWFLKLGNEHGVLAIRSEHCTSAEYGNLSSGRQIGTLPSVSESGVRSLSTAKLGSFTDFSGIAIGSIIFKIPRVGECQLRLRILLLLLLIGCIGFIVLGGETILGYFELLMVDEIVSTLLKMVYSSVCSRKLHKNSTNSNTTVCLSCIVTLLHFLICNVLLTQCEITDCGVQIEENSFLLQHIVYFIGIRDGVIFKDCIGTLMPSAPNHTHSDTVITSRYCFTHWETLPLVVIGGEFLEDVLIQGIHMVRMISPFGRAEANAANIPFNFAIIKLSANIPFSSVAIAACLKSDLVINSNTTCYMPNIHDTYLNAFGLPFKMSILHPVESCAQLSSQLKLSPLKHICATFIMPPVLAMSHLLDAFQCGFRFTSLLFHDHLLFFIFGHGSVGIFKDCIGTLMLTNENSTHGDLILTSKYCLDSGSMQNAKVLPSHLNANYVNVHGYGVRKIITPTEKQSWKELKLPYNFALLQLSAMVPISSWITPVCLPSAHIHVPLTSACFLPKTTYHVYSGFTQPFIFVRMPSFWCMARSKEIVLTDGENFCAVLHVTTLQHYNHLLAEINTSLFEGAPLLCLYQDRFYQVGIFDWLKIFRDNSTRPIAVFSSVTAIAPLIEQAIVGNISNEYYSFMSSIDF
ncbi:hypothetical protein T11_12847 [Trichinella zimbabwensis]|uniref:Peptidase S1 domain-containing protein n=2 Tax=Trichinella zimbabwensis TaxID=268475 RepID=A0A0V1H417_9BILA|nr:hypothetical protein T11_12847 [Trichinella zimbabwensis]